MTEPIVRSLLDLDLYKLTMLQLIWRRHLDVPVTFEFKNRTSNVRLTEWMDFAALLEELAAVRLLRFTDSEIAYLRSLGMFDAEFLAWLPTLRLPDIEAHPHREEHQFTIAATGPWSQVTLWETIVLSIVNELYYRTVRRHYGHREDVVHPEGFKRLNWKCATMHMRSDIRVAEFGTRRRHSSRWQRAVVSRLCDLVPNSILGTSNVFLAKELGLNPIGTFAHELDMVYSGIYRDRLRESHQLMLKDWWDEYGEPLSIALTDTYTSDFFFEDMTREQARAWRGLRQDSGDPLAFADKAIAFYERHGIDPKTKMIVFSDGLDIEAILRIADHCRGYIAYAFGWGTNLTNDLGFPALSLVMKATRAAGHGLVKLSDNLAKAQGTPEDVALFTRTFGHAPTVNEACRY